MNFLSHFHFYKTEQVYTNLGLVLPDLVKAICKKHLKLNDQYSAPIFKALSEGAKTHLESDIRFHNSIFFKNTTEFISHLLDGGGNWPRKWFFNHLLCEISIDRVLMKRHSNLCHEFYDIFTKVNYDQVNLFLKFSGVTNHQNFSPGIERFVSYKFIFDYIHNEKIIEALNRVYHRVGIEYIWSDEDKLLLLTQLPNILNYIDNNMHYLEQELK